MRPACHGMEPSAIAFGSRSRATSCGIERHAARLVEGAEGAAQRGHDEQVLDAGQPEDGEDEGRGQRQRDRDLRHEQEPQPVDAIREDAAAELEEDERHALGQPEIAQRHRVSRRPPT